MNCSQTPAKKIPAISQRILLQLRVVRMVSAAFTTLAPPATKMSSCKASYIIPCFEIFTSAMATKAATARSQTASAVPWTICTRNSSP